MNMIPGPEPLPRGVKILLAILAVLTILELIVLKIVSNALTF